MSSNIQIFFSDPGKTVTPGPIVITDGTINNQSTSLTLVGRNYPGNYGQYFAQDFLNMLENFSNAVPPNNPIQGQLWFDTSNPNKPVLRVNNGGGNTWTPINGLYQQATAPTTALLGDIWVNTNSQQLFIYNGNSFTLIGPNYSSATKTGSYPTTVTDIYQTSHNIIINYINDIPVEIIATESFVPNPVIAGFTTLQVGINMSAATINSAKPVLNGVATAATHLQIKIPTVQQITADSFVRNDIDQTVNGRLWIQTNNGLSIGQQSQLLTVQTPNTYQANFYNNNLDNAGQFNFIFNKNGLNTPLLTLSGSTYRVGINTVTPTADLDILGNFNVGNVTTSSVATFDTVVIRSTINPQTTTTGALQVVGGAGIGGTLVVNGEHILLGSLTIGPGSAPTLAYSDKAMVIPTQSTFTIGDPNAPWEKVYSTIFQGPSSLNNNATFVGTLDGSARQLSGTINFVWDSANGDISAPVVQTNGTNLYPTFTATIVANAIISKPVAPVVPASTSTIAIHTTSTDTLLLYRPDDGNLYKQTKSDFLKDINYQPPGPGIVSPGSLVPAGTIILFAGIVSGPQANIPPGWVLCDGTSYPAGGPAYKNLFSVIQNTYGGLNTPNFNVPTLAGPATGLSYLIKT